MIKAKTIPVVIACVLVTTLVAGAYLLFHGYFDRGKFQITNAQWSSPVQVAMVGKRSDDEALSSDQYFVLIGDHLLSPPELRRRYHSADVIFSSDGDCLKLHWEDSYNLIVTCDDNSIEARHIAVQQRRSGQIAISYVNIADKR